MRKIEIKFLILLVALFVLLSNANESYARYANSISNDTNVDFRTWRILVNNVDVTYNYTTTMQFTPTVIDRTNYVRSGKFAPGSTGYFDIYINPTAVKTNYTASFSVSKTGSVSNLKVIGYSKLNTNAATTSPQETFQKQDGTYDDTNVFSLPFISQGTINNTSYYVRIFFKWIDNYNNTSTNSSDSAIGESVGNGNDQSVNYNIAVTITFTQLL